MTSNIDEHIKNLYPYPEYTNVAYIKRENILGQLYLTFKIQSKEQQLSSLIKLLEYINMLEDKNKQLENDKLLFKVEQLEEEIMNLRSLF